MQSIQSPIPQFFDTDGSPLDDGSIYIGIAGYNPITTPIAVFWDMSGSIPAAQPLSTVNGYIARNGTPAPIFVNSDDYSIIVRNKKGVLVFASLYSTYETAAVAGSSEWESSSLTATFINSTQFSVPGDATALFQVDRRVKAPISLSPFNAYGTVATSVFSAGVTTVTLSPLSTSLDSGLTGQVPYVGILSATNPSVPALSDAVFRIVNSADRTKKLAFDLSNLTSATRTRTMLNKGGYETVANDIFDLHNCSLFAESLSNNLVLRLKTTLGLDPTPGNPALITFRVGTVTDGSGGPILATGAVSLTINAGSTLGFANGESGRIWVCAINNGGAIELACYRSWNGTGWKRISEGVLSTTAEGSGAADSAQVLYSASARTNVAMKYLGYIDIQYGTAQWSNAPTLVQTNTGKMPLPGDVVQRAYLSDGAYATGAGTIPHDDTIPQITEGNQFMSLTITPLSGANLLEVNHHGLYTTNGAAEYLAMALFRDAGANALVTSVSSQNGADPQGQQLFYQGIAGSTAATAFKVRAGATAGATYFNGWSAARKYGGSMGSFLSINEVVV